MIRFFVMFLIVLCWVQSASAVVFRGLGSLPNNFRFSMPTDISADGTVVVGQSRSALGNEAFRWSAQTGMIGLGLGSTTSSASMASAISADGSVITGYLTEHDGFAGFRWTSPDGFSDIGSFGGPTSTADISADGQVIVGSGDYPPVNCPAGYAYCEIESFRWTDSSGIVGLGDLESSDLVSVSAGVSADGSVVVGLGTTLMGDEAFRWTAETGMVGLGDLPGGVSESYATAISADGNVTIGVANSALGREAFRWTTESGMIGLGDFPGGGFQSAAADINADGSVIVGRGKDFTGDVPFIWDEQHGMRLVTDLLTDAGAMPSGWTLTMATAISSDGKVIVGSGWGPSGHIEAWLIELDSTPGDANYDNQVDAEDLEILLSQYGQTNSFGILTADFNKDNQVSLADLLILKKNYSSTSSAENASNQATMVPEPSSLINLVIGLLCVAGFYYRRW